MKRFFLALLIVPFACDTDPVMQSGTQIKLDYYIDYYTVENEEFEAFYKVEFEYADDGKLLSGIYSTYNPESEAFERQRYSVLEYVNGSVSSIKGFDVGEETYHIAYNYTYEQNRVSRIVEINTVTGPVSEANFAYFGSDSIRVSYTFSNGSADHYAVRLNNSNVTLDESTHNGQLCSKGIYSYDSKQNPFKTLGYVDFHLMHLSANNKLIENVDYSACSLPIEIPESHEYEYNEEGFPTEVTTHYKTTGKSKRQYFYKRL